MSGLVSARDLDGRMAQLASARRPFVEATVVRAQEPTSARAGDTAIVLDDGTVEGFVGGQCTVTSVRAAALETLRDGGALLLRVLPEESTAFPDSPGARVVVNPCHSGGAIEIFLRPVLPPPTLRVVGGTPVAAAVATLAEFLGFAVQRDGADEPSGVAVIVASLGRDEEAAIRAALDAGVGFVGLVASRRRGAEVLDGMGLTDTERARVHTPVGLPIGARTPQEIALSALAEVVRAIRVNQLNPRPASPAHPPPQPATSEATREGDASEAAEPARIADPVCGMTVVVGPDTPHLRVDGRDHWFCCPGCRDRFAARHGG